MKNALIIFTKIPIVGFTKTRLNTILTQEQAAQLTHCFLQDLIHIFSNSKEFNTFLYYTPQNQINKISNIIPSNIFAYPQVNGDIGDKMYHAIKNTFEKGYQKVALIGSDIPELQTETIKKAFILLDTKDVVFGPSKDGGYYLIATKPESCKQHIFNLDNLWSSDMVLQNSINLSKGRNLTVGFTEELQDIDTKDDLLQFYKNNKHLDNITIRFLHTIIK